MQEDREIDALLSNGGTGSIIDRLMALPRPAANEACGEWDRAVAGRLQVHLARQMRTLLEQNEPGRSAA
jgi:hypothetical protein